MGFVPPNRLDALGEATTLLELRARLRSHRWAPELDAFERAPGAVRLLAAGLDAPEEIDTGNGPYVVLVEGPLRTTGHLHLWTDDYQPGLVIVRGDLEARTLSFGNGARVFVEGSVRVEGELFGQYGDHNAVLMAAGEIRARAIFLDTTAGVYAEGGVQSLIHAPLRMYESLAPDIENEGVGDGVHSFDPAVLDAYGDLDFRKAIQAAREGRPLFLPGIEERFPLRLTLRATR
ncbi:hypothetical protein OV207_25620 [Corallococcus sp. BB11-1]|uniref:hypothetical protein n=1 Tax=Corallococcus sp. BB11-1 TaxID=2996783 RepID=UPI0022716155|nr:hypothetical protein [Corallococcus sp. BB11-1]MCY1034852.1 hypothetical protein [Corallococcus sp. BB11-1]